MTWGYSGGYSNAVEGGLSLDIPGITKDSSGNYYYKGIRLVNFLKDTDKLMSDSTELDVYKDILLGKLRFKKDKERVSLVLFWHA